MNSSHEELALNQLQLALWAIQEQHSMLAAFLAQMAQHMNCAPERMVIAIRGDQLTIVVNPTWIIDAELEAVVNDLIQQALHLYLDHHRIDAHGYDPTILQRAKDLCVEDFLRERQEQDTDTKPTSAQVPPETSVRERYAQLLRESQTRQRSASHDGHEEGMGPLMQEQDDRLANSDQPQPDSANGQSRAQGPGRPPGTDGEPDAETPMDTRVSAQQGQVRDEAFDDPADHQAVIIAALMAGAAAVASHEHLSDLEKRLLLAVPELAIGPGTDPLGQYEDIEQRDAQRIVPWKKRLREFVGQARPEPRVSYVRPNRRLPQWLGIVPGRQPGPGRPHIQVNIDTSGSMTRDMLTTISSELKYLSHRNRVMVVECDADIQRIYRYRGKLDGCRGRGGTSFTPPFQHSVIRQTRAELIVYFTDGYGDAPPDPPTIPVLWVIIGEGPVPAKWGESVRMEGEPQFESGRGGSKTRRRSPRGMSGGGNQDVYFPP